MAPAKARIKAGLPTQLAYAGSSAAGSPASRPAAAAPATTARRWAPRPPRPTPPTGRRSAGVISGTARTYRILSNGTFEVSPDGATWTPWSSWLTLSNMRGAALRADADGPGSAAVPDQQRQQPLRRGFSVENGLISSLQHRVSGPGVDGTDWTGTNSLTVIDGKLYHSTATARCGAPTSSTAAGDGHHRDHQRPDGRRPELGEHVVALHARGDAAPPPPPPPPPDHVYENHFDGPRRVDHLVGLHPRHHRRRPGGLAAVAAWVTSTAPGPSPVGPSASSYQEICSAVSVRLNRLTIDDRAHAPAHRRQPRGRTALRHRQRHPLHPLRRGRRADQHRASGSPPAPGTTSSSAPPRGPLARSPWR